MAGEYVLGRKLGVGGFGTVYEAEHPILKRRAAVKVLHPNRSLDSVAVARFVAEAQSASQIRHRHIVDIFSFGTLPGGQYFYVMDFLEGEPLDRFLIEHQELAPELAMALLRPVAQALDALHAVGVVHRDVKPPNIYLAWDSNDEVVPKLLDFGLVKLLGETPIQTASGVPMGTPHYMSPEQCRGEKVDARSDVYAFGIVCHELLAGRPPFTGESAAAVLVAHVLQPAPRLSEMRPDLPRELDQPVLEMLAKSPADRPNSVGLAFERLERAARQANLTVVEGLPHLPRPPQPVAPAKAEISHTVEVGSDRIRARSSLQPASAEKPRSALRVYLALGAVAAAVALAIPLLVRPQQPQLLGEVSASAPASPASALAVTSGVESARTVQSRPARIAEVNLMLLGAPLGALVFRGEQKLGEAPGPLRLPQGEQSIELSVQASGYEPKSVSVVPSKDSEVRVSLTKLRAVGKSGRISRDLENPF